MPIEVNKMYTFKGKEVRDLDAKKIGAKLKELRGSRSQKEVADAVNVTDMAISFYESGDRIPRDEIKVALADYFGVSVESIFYT